MTLLNWILNRIFPDTGLINGVHPCPACGGTGWARGSSFAHNFPCPECNGQGIIIED